MLQNLSSGMPSLQEVEIREYDSLDQSNIVEFLKDNPYLKKLNTENIDYNEEMLNTILSYQCLKHLVIENVSFEGIEFNDLPCSYSIKYLLINDIIPTHIALQLINSCIRIEALELDI